MFCHWTILSRPVYIYHNELLIVFCHLYFDLVIWVVIFNQQSTYLCQLISVILGSQQMCSQFFWKHSHIVELVEAFNSSFRSIYDVLSLNNLQFGNIYIRDFNLSVLLSEVFPGEFPLSQFWLDLTLFHVFPVVCLQFLLTILGIISWINCLNAN
jgi:hypothetical protein